MRPFMVGTASILAISASFLPASARGDDAGPGSVTILNGSRVVQALSYLSWTVAADTSVMAEPTILGRITASGGTGNDIRLLVLSEPDFANWKNNHPVAPIYDSGQITSADVKARLGDAGTYYVVLSNMFSTVTPKTVEGTLALTWKPGPALIAAKRAEVAARRAQEDQLRALEAQEKKARERQRVMFLATFGLFAAAAGGGVVALVASRRKAPARG